MIPKIRAWDEEKKTMCNVRQIDFRGGEFRSSENEWMKFDNVIFMQSTGMKDKTGTEIYEGDILLSTASENQEDWKKWQVHYADGRFLIDYKQIPKDKRKRANLELEDLCEDNIWLYGLEVIGNIYENPEMMEVYDDKY